MSESTWRNYEEITAYILNEISSSIGLERVEGKQHVKGQLSDTDWEIDAKGILDVGTAFVIIECRRYTTSRIPQSHIASLVYQIQDTKAKSGIIVSPLGVQEGAAKIAEAEGIITLNLSEKATRESFFLKFLNELFLKNTENITVAEDVNVEISPENSDNYEV